MSRIDQTTLDRMFTIAGIDRHKLYDALRVMGPAELKPHLRSEWSPENPTRNFCYVIAEFVYCYIAPPGSTAHRLKIPGDVADHIFVRWPDRTIADLAADQFADYALVKYDEATKTHFQHPSPSRRARRLAELMGWTGRSQ